MLGCHGLRPCSNLDFRTLTLSNEPTLACGSNPIWHSAFDTQTFRSFHPPQLRPKNSLRHIRYEFSLFRPKLATGQKLLLKSAAPFPKTQGITIHKNTHLSPSNSHGPECHAHQLSSTPTWRPWRFTTLRLCAPSRNHCALRVLCGEFLPSAQYGTK